MNKYKNLNNQIYKNKEFCILPIRYKDRFDIMKWRNEQIYHLRQKRPLSADDQENYFANVVNKLFDQDKPEQILFSFLQGDTCIGYGGLVHINWVDNNAEISFIMDTGLEKEHFEKYWSVYLKLIEEIAFRDLKLHKLYVYAFDLRPHLYEMLLKNNYFLDARLKDHCYFKEKYIDVVIHSKLRKT